jgi:hypothetical protein
MLQGYHPCLQLTVKHPFLPAQQKLWLSTPHPQYTLGFYCLHTHLEDGAEEVTVPVLVLAPVLKVLKQGVQLVVGVALQVPANRDTHMHMFGWPTTKHPLHPHKHTKEDLSRQASAFNTQQGRAAAPWDKVQQVVHRDKQGSASSHGSGLQSQNNSSDSELQQLAVDSQGCSHSSLEWQLTCRC